MKKRLFSACIILALILVGCSAGTDKNETNKPEGKYAATLTEEIEGEDISYEVSYTFNSDGTGVFDAQDRIDFTWDDDYIYMNDEKYAFELKDNCLSVSEYFGTQDYYRQ